MKLKKILVPIDLSEFSLEAVEPACSLASQYHAQIYLLHVIPIQSPLSVPAVDHLSETITRDAEEAALKQLDCLIAKKMLDTNKLVHIMRRGEPGHEIVKFANDERIDLVVMATHGRTGLAHVFMWSVAEKVIRNSSVHVLTVKPRAVQERFLQQNDVAEELHIPKCDLK